MVCNTNPVSISKLNLYDVNTKKVAHTIYTPSRQHKEKLTSPIEMSG